MGRYLRRGGLFGRNSDRPVLYALDFRNVMHRYKIKGLNIQIPTYKPLSPVEKAHTTFIKRPLLTYIPMV
jgi:hypothetical protein